MFPKIKARNISIIKKIESKKFEDENLDKEMLKFKSMISGKYFDPWKLRGEKMQMLQQVGINFANVMEKKGSEEISNDEALFIKRASYGVTMEYEKGYEFENMTQYDMNSSHGFIMAHEKFYIPFKKGTIGKIHEIDDSKIGIYRLHIKGNPSKYCVKVRNDGQYCGYYTQYDMLMMDFLGVEYELDQVEEFNSCVWDKTECVKGSDLFGELMTQLFKAKSQNSGSIKEISKFLMASLHGQLSTLYEKEYSLNVLDKYKIEDVKQINVQNETFTLKGSPFIYHLGRIKPFIYSFSRLTMGRIAHKVMKKGYKVVKINTDCIVTDAPEKWFDKKFNISDKIGHFKIEKKFEGKHIINGLHKIDKI